MVSKKFRLAAIGALATLVSAVSPTLAATVLKSGDNVDGWTINFPVGIALISDGGSSLVLEKAAAFTSTEGLAITFVQTSKSASSKITITDESVTNVTGSSFGSFQFLLANPTKGTPAAFTGEVFKPAPFTTVTKTPSSITFGGGSLANGKTALWGFGSDGDLVINSNPSSDLSSPKVFTFKEIPGGGGGNLIPVPAAAWTGLTGLAGLGVIGSAKKLRRLLA